MTNDAYAVIEPGSDTVANIILCESGFTIDGHEIKKIQAGALCEPGMYYNRQDEGFYFDPEFTKKEPSSPIVPENF